jgi:ATP-dependent Clp protease ATP-binding subunit ClpA
MTITVTDSFHKTPIYIDPTYIIAIRPVSSGGAALTDIFGGVYSTVESPDQVVDLIEAEVAAVNAYTETYFVPDVTQDEKDQVIADLNKEIEELENEVQELNDEIFNLTDEDEDLSDETEDDLDDDDLEDDDDEDGGTEGSELSEGHVRRLLLTTS